MNRRLGGESDREILMVPACVVLSLGLCSWISAPVARRALNLLADSSGVLKKNINIRSTVLGFYGLLRIFDQQSWGFKEKRQYSINSPGFLGFAKDI